MTHINELEYGNPSIDHIPLINDPSYLDRALLAELCDKRTYAFPFNDSSITKQELLDIADKAGTCQTDDIARKRFQQYDESIISAYSLVEFTDQEETEKYKNLLVDIFKDITPLIIKLKFEYQRPRPYSIARYYRLKVFPFYSYSSDNPSYPSLHGCYGHLMAAVLSNLYPQSTKYFYDLGNDICISRMFLGLNFQSSLNFGKTVAEKILQNPDFQRKYKL